MIVVGYGTQGLPFQMKPHHDIAPLFLKKKKQLLPFF